MENKNENPNKKGLITAIVIIILIAFLSIGGIFAYKYFSAEKEKDSKGVVGKISDGWDTGIEEESQQQQGRGIQIPGYGIAVMEEGDTSLVLSVGNPKANNCGFYATLKLEDGTELYKSELLKPGYGLTEIPLSQTLKAGEYTAIVYYKCVTLDEEQSPLNSAESEFKLIVK